MSTGVDDGIVRVTPSLAFAFAFPEVRRRNLLTRRERRESRRTKGHSGGGNASPDGGADSNGNGGNDGTDYNGGNTQQYNPCLLYTSPSPRD